MADCKLCPLDEKRAEALFQAMKASLEERKYEIVVGNVGIVYAGPDRKIAESSFETYVNLSKIAIGRVAGEPVTWFEGSMIVQEYEPE